ncbi:CDP-alcohol phosphatidyltransferase family protein [Rariglobus hedericola]|uniref:CDP-diacylglycerol--serine O-phosphatidyltransferase n=1 Tax=Rariglobus hedericola TaxID=2597822 RepID=A0A556QJ18_9BACT|nr:CDP-alcohol phosphatidyltransferase family protein [Rariglobus hedericola]TSJ76617.1 CDP-diacylglycerol--serine O-phosphatidyltransferase [Rariglobus hedericola]
MANDTPPPTDNEADPYSIEQASRIYFLPNLMTAGNLFCGLAACLRCIEASFIARGAEAVGVIPPEAIAHYKDAIWYIFGAMAFDALDGRLARMGGKESLFGAEFDSLADVVSFGLAPALMVFFLIIRPAGGDQTLLSVGGLIGFIYLLCAAIRLARFNVITHPLLQKPGSKSANKDFIGLPVPAAAGTVAALMLFLLNLLSNDKSLQWITLGLPPLLLLVAMLMVSTVRYPSGKQIDLRTKTKLTTLVLYVAVGAAVVRFKEYGMIIVCLGYIFYGLARHWRRHGPIKRAPLV